MALSPIGFHSAAGSSVATVNNIGDLLVICAFRSASATPPTNPGGWTEPITAPANGGGGTNNSCRIAFRFAASANQGSGVWTNATAVAVRVYRGARIADPIGGIDEDSVNSTSTVINYPAVALQDLEQLSHLCAFGMRTTTGAIAAVATAPPGMVNLGSVPATPYLACHEELNRAVDWPLETVAVGGTSVKSIGVVMEILPEPEPAIVLSSPTVVNIDGTGGQPRVTTDGTNDLYYVVVADGDPQPSNVQILSGENAAGTPALAAATQEVLAPGEQTFPKITTLAPLTAYDVWFYSPNSPGALDTTAVKADFTTLAGAPQIEMQGTASGAGSATGDTAARISIVGQSSSIGSAQAALAAHIALAGAVTAAGSTTGALRGITAITGQINAAGVLTGVLVRVQPIQGQVAGSGLTAATLRAIIELIGSVTGIATAVAAFEEEGGFITGAVIGIGSAAAELTLWQPLEGVSQGIGLTEADVETIISLTGAGSGFGLALADLSAILTMLGHAMASGTPGGNLSNIISFVIEIPPCPSIVEIAPSQTIVLLDPSLTICEIVPSTTTVDLICLTTEEEEALANG